MAIQSSARSSDGPDYRTLARRALAEDRAGSDRTSRSLLRPGTRATAVVVAQASGILSGGRAAASVATAGGVRVVGRVPDGRPIRAGMAVLRLEGEARRILAVERSLLNVLMHASGIASATARAVRATRRSRPRLQVWATRKTLPGLRDLEKAAVVDGGGQPHRRDLDAGLLIKSNHLEFVPLEEAIARARRHARAGERVEVEVRT
ncbi:MAG: carboxylating.nicotinate-nucleotide diphosphorylase, partial [Thermoplasmata archaeon]